MFFNTGSATYIWILDNTKRERRLIPRMDAVASRLLDSKYTLTRFPASNSISRRRRALSGVSQGPWPLYTSRSDVREVALRDFVVGVVMDDY
jgi:hypothetical protein